MFVVIMGCGRVGARLALLLTQAGHEVAVIDQLRAAFGRLGADFPGTTLLGDGLDQEVLGRADIQRADVFVAATQGDNRNIMASEIAQRIFNVPTVVTRIYDPLRAETFASLGLHTISPTLVGADRLVRRGNWSAGRNCADSQQTASRSRGLRRSGRVRRAIRSYRRRRQCRLQHTSLPNSNNAIEYALLRRA